MRSSATTDRTRAAVGSSTSAAWRHALADALGPSPRRVLDVGCGDGAASFLLWDLGHYPQGVDCAADRVKRARSTAHSRCAAVPFQVGDAESLDFPAGVFDAVVARDVLLALPHPDWALAEWYRVLKPGGVLVVGETTPAARGRTGAAEYLRFAGFVDVESRESSALASETRGGASWFRRLTRHAARTGVVTWGTRP